MTATNKVHPKSTSPSPVGDSDSDRVVLGRNQYGKAEIRLVKVTRDSDRHSIDDFNVTSQLHGDFESAHTLGDNSQVIATDTQKNTVYALSKEQFDSPEQFILRLGKHFTENYKWISGGRWFAEKYSWDRINYHDHAFSRNKSETRCAGLLIVDEEVHLIAGIEGLTVLKSTGSEFRGFPRDKYTTLQETSDRILATDVSAKWRYNRLDVDFNEVYTSMREILLNAFASTHSLALQQSMFQMGKLALEAHPEIDEIRFSLPNKHHFLVDLSPFDLDNDNEIFFAADRPYGLIEATVERKGAQGESPIWATTPGFC